MAIEPPRPEATPDALFARYRRTRDPAALGALFDAAAPGLFRLAVSLTPDASRAEDALQETFLFALEEADRWDPARPVVPWLMTVLRFKVKEGRRRDSRTPDPLRLDRAPDPDDPAALAESAEERERLYEAMRRLPEPYRGVALLRWRYGHEPAEIADIRGEPPGTVWSILHRALKKLKVEMGAMPALLLAFRPERGLDGVRRALLRRAAAKAAATAAAGTGAGVVAVTTMGGFLMANKAGVAVAAVVLLGGIGWFALRPEPASIPTSPPGPVVAEVGKKPSVLPPTSPPAVEAAAPAAPPVPDPVDFTQCDRDLDLFGTVVDEKDQPVPGASVAAFTRICPDVPVLPANLRGEGTAGPTTRSARDGSFRLRLARGSHVDLKVAAAGYPGTVINWRCAGEKVRIVLRQGATLIVVTKDDSGQPAAGTIVTLGARDETGKYGFFGSATTGADGRCTLNGLAACEVIVRAEHPVLGMTQGGERKIPSSGSVTVELVLPRGRMVTGRVVDAKSGAPIAGATVGEGWVLARPVKTGSDGRYEKPGLPSSEDTDLFADAAGYSRLEVRDVAGGTADFALHAGDTVIGRLLGADGEPLADAFVVAIGTTQDSPGHIGQDAREGRTEGDGRFRIGGLRHDIVHTLVATATGSGRLLRPFGAAAEEGGTVDLGDVRMPAERSVEGVLLNGSGDALADRPVVLRRAGEFRYEDAYTREMARRTDDLGRFRFHGLTAGAYEVSLANLPGLTPAKVEVLVPEDRDVLDVVLRMPAGGDLRVLVTDPEGNPLPGIALNIMARENSRKGRTDEEGRASFTGLPQSEVQVRAWDMSKPRRWIGDSSTGVAVNPEGQEVKVVLREAAWIRGRVLGPDGAGLPGMMLTYRSVEDKSGFGATTGADGSFELAAPKGVRMVVELNGYRQPEGSRGRPEKTPYKAQSVEAAVPSEGIEIRTTAMESNRRLTLRVIDLEGGPLKNFGVSLLKPGERSYPMTDEKGEYTADGLLAEEMTISVFAPGVAPGQPSPVPDGAVLPAPVKLVPDGQVVTMQLRKGVPFAGTVYKMDGQPAEKAMVTIQTADFVATNGTTDATGRFKVWVTPGQKLMMAAAVLMGPNGPAEMKQLQGADLEKAMEKSELEIHLEPYKGR